MSLFRVFVAKIRGICLQTLSRRLPDVSGLDCSTREHDFLSFRALFHTPKFPAQIRSRRLLGCWNCGSQNGQIERLLVCLVGVVFNGFGTHGIHHHEKPPFWGICLAFVPIILSKSKKMIVQYLVCSKKGHTWWRICAAEKRPDFLENGNAKLLESF